MTDSAATPQPQPQQTVKPLPREVNPVFNGSNPATKVDRVEYSSSGTVRVVEVPAQPDKGFTWDKAFDEIRAGIWAVGLTGVFIWVATAALRNKLTEGITAYFRKQVEILDTVKVATTNNSQTLSGMESRSKAYIDKVQLIEDNTTETLEILKDMRNERYKES